MGSVSRAVSQARQPKGGYIRNNQFSEIPYNDEKILYRQENLNPGLIGATVDYLSRYMMGTKVTEAFKPSCLGAIVAEKNFKYNGAINTAKELLKKIKGLSGESISCACKMAGFDVYYRAPEKAIQNRYNVIDIVPDVETISNIRIMVERSVSFWKLNGPIIKDGITFEPCDNNGNKIDTLLRTGSYGGYTLKIDCGDGDYITADTLWDFKTLRKKPTSKHTLQILVYWIMGRHSERPEFKTIEKIGIFNPRLNEAYVIRVGDIPQGIIDEVEENVIGYPKEQKNRKYKKGCVVKHHIFGRGEVLSVMSVASHQIVEINFETVGIKKVISDSTALTRITTEE